MADQKGMTSKKLWKWFRKHEKMILAAIVVLIVPAFGFGGILIATVSRSMERTEAAVIDGEEISRTEFDQAQSLLARLVRVYVNFLKARGYAREEHNLESADVFKHILLLQQAEKADIRVTDEEADRAIEHYLETAQTAPYLVKSGEFLTPHEQLLYAQTLSHHVMFGILRGKEFSEKKYASFLGRMRLKEEEFRNFVKEVFTVLKFKYYLWNSVRIPASQAFEAYKEDHVAHQCAYVRFDAEDFEAPSETIEPDEIRAHYTNHVNRFRDPVRKRVEVAVGRIADLTDRTVLSEQEKERFYRENRDVLFRAPEDEAEEEKEGEEDANGDEEEAEPAEEAPVYLDYASEEVQAEIQKRLSERKARDFLDRLFHRISAAVKRTEESIRRDPSTFQDPRESLRTEIRYARFAENVAEDPDWIAPYMGYELETYRTEKAYAREEMREALGAVGPRIADKAWELRALTTSDPIPIPGGTAIFRVLEVVPATVPPLETIEDEVLEDLRLSRALDAALARAREVRQKMLASSFEAAAREANLEVRKTVYFKAGDASVPGDGEHPPLGEVPNVITAAFSMGTQDVSRPVMERNAGAVFLLEVVDRKYPDPSEMPDAELERLLEKERQKVWEDVNAPWGDDFRGHHEIEDLTRGREPK